MQSFIKKTALLICIVSLFSCSHQNRIKEYVNNLENLPFSIEKINSRIYKLNDDYNYEYAEKMRLFKHNQLIFEKEIIGNLYTNSKGQCLFAFADSFVYLVNNYENQNKYSVFSIDKDGNETCILSKSYSNEKSKYYSLACDKAYKYIYLSYEIESFFVDKYALENNQLIFIETNENKKSLYIEEVLSIKEDNYFIDINGNIIKNYYSSLTGISKTIFVEDDKLYGYSIRYSTYEEKYYMELFDDENIFKTLFDFSSETYAYYTFGNKNSCLFVFVPMAASKDECSYIFLYDREENQTYGSVLNDKIFNFAYINDNFYYTQGYQDYMIHI